MLAFFLVIALIAGFVNIAFYCIETQRIDQTLDSIINYDAYRPRFNGRGGGFGGRAGDEDMLPRYLLQKLLL